MKFYIEEFINLKKYASELTAGLEPIFYNAKIPFTLQYTLLLAPLCLDDNQDIRKKKFYIVSSFIDITIVRRIWNFKSINYSTIQDSMFNVIKDIRNKNVTELSKILIDKLNKDENTFRANSLKLQYGNKNFIHYLLARITDYIETSSGGMVSHFNEYMAKGKNRYEIEHIWADHPERHTDEFTVSSDFEDYRNRLGGLLLLPRSFNASFGDLDYDEKLEHYFGQNLLAKSLYSRCYENNPGFLKFKEEKELSFRAHPNFKKNDLAERQELYKQIAELIWNTYSISQFI